MKRKTAIFVAFCKVLLSYYAIKCILYLLFGEDKIKKCHQSLGDIWHPQQETASSCRVSTGNDEAVLRTLFRAQLGAGLLCGQQKESLPPGSRNRNLLRLSRLPTRKRRSNVANLISWQSHEAGSLCGQQKETTTLRWLSLFGTRNRNRTCN